MPSLLVRKKPRIRVVCEHCKRTFEVLPHRAKKVRFCSQACNGKFKSRTSEEEAIPNAGECACGNLTMEADGVCLACKAERRACAVG